MLMPHDQFRNIVRLKPIESENNIKIPTYFANLLTVAKRQKSILGKYIGYYYQYYNSFSRDNCILRSLLVIYHWQDYTLYKRLERLKLQNEDSAPDVYKYVGILTTVGDRLHFIDQESITGHELSHTIIYPSYRNRVTTLSGLTMGVSGSDQRLISASPAVLEYLGQGIRLRQAIEGCRIYENASTEIPVPVLEALRRSPPVDVTRALQIPPLM